MPLMLGCRSVKTPQILQDLNPERLSVLFGVQTLIAVLVLTVALLAPVLFFETPDIASSAETLKARVTRIVEERMQAGPRGQEQFQRLELDLDGRTITIERTQAALDPRSVDVHVGDSVLVTSSPGPQGQKTYFLADYARDGSLWLLAVAFVAVVLVVGRVQGAMSLLGMGISLLVILRFIIPGIVSGYDPVTISIAGAATIMASSLYLSHGVNRKTTIALLGTTLGLALTAGLASFSIGFAKLSGLADDESATLDILTNGGINPEGLLLAGFIIGALGVLDDVTVAQASSVFELRRANPLLSARQLFGRAMNIGRDHIASTVNTLFLAYAGAALPLLIILSLQTEPVGVLVNREFLATEIVRTLVGSIGIVAAVPITTGLAAYATRAASETPGDTQVRRWPGQ